MVDANKRVEMFFDFIFENVNEEEANREYY